MKRLFCVLFALLFTVLLGGCSENEEISHVRLGKREIPSPSVISRTKPLRVAIGGMITPKEGFAYYRGFLTYIEEKMGRPVEFIDKQSYAEINEMLEAG